jgi:hypothetical protein
MRETASKTMVGAAVAALVTVSVTACGSTPAQAQNITTVTAPLTGDGRGNFTATARCPSGTAVTGGGYSSRGQDANGSITETYPDTSASWKVTINDTGTGNGAPIPNVTGTVYAVCSR